MKLLPARIRFPKVNWLRFFSGVWPWMAGGLFVGLAAMDALLGHYLPAWLEAVLALIMFLDGKKWDYWMRQRANLEGQLHSTNAALHASALATKAAMRTGHYEAVEHIADMNAILAEAYLLSRRDVNLKVGADDAG